MKQRGQFLLVNTFAAALLLLSGCGGAGSNTTTGIIDSESPDNAITSHPRFSRLTVSLSPSFAPSGEITDTTPTFSWQAIANATEYQFGHEITDTAEDWHLYSVTSSEANCDGSNQECAYTPNDYTFAVGEERVWWVRAKVAGAWQDWSSSHVFSIIQDPNTGGDIPKEIAPIGDITVTNPEFSWTAVTNATDYQVGHENVLTWGDWHLSTISASQSNCLNASQNCTYTPTSNFAVGDQKVWWVRAMVNGAWGEWSAGSEFSVIDDGSVVERPLKLRVKTHMVRGAYGRPIIFKKFNIRAQGTGFNYNVDCNSDGVFEATGVTGDYVCEYPKFEEYTISISGNYPHLQFSGFNLLQDVEQWGTQKWRSMENTFANTGLIKVTATDVPNLTLATSMNEMFSGTKLAIANGFANWDVSHVTNMRRMFKGSQFNQDISSWNVGKVTDMSEMFSFQPYNYSFNQDIGNWDVSNVTNMAKMFSHSSTFNQDISNWNVSHVTDMSDMFNESYAFNQKIGNWDVSKVTNMSNMFYRANAFNQDIGSWNVAKVTNMAGMFYGNGNDTVFNQDIGSWNVSNVTDMSSMFVWSAFNQDISNWDVSKVTDMSDMFSATHNFNQDIGNWNVSNVTDMNRMFAGSKAFNKSLNNWDVSKVTNMRSMFSWAKVFNQNLNNWDVSHVTNMMSMFEHALVFNQPIGNWDVSQVTNMWMMFFDEHVFNQPIGNWNVGNVTNMSDMFSNAYAFNQDIGNWSVGKVKTMGSMFNTAKNFNQNISNWDVSSVETFYHMFNNAISFDQDLSNWDVSSTANYAFNPMLNIFKGVTLSTANYDKLLNSWSQLTLKHDIEFNGGNSKYSSASETARNNLINDYGWVIIDGGKI